MIIYLRGTCKYIDNYIYIAGGSSAWVVVQSRYQYTEAPTPSSAQKNIEFVLRRKLEWSSSHTMTQVVNNVTNQPQILIQFSSFVRSISRLLLRQFCHEKTT